MFTTVIKSEYFVDRRACSPACPDGKIMDQSVATIANLIIKKVYL